MPCGRMVFGDWVNIRLVLAENFKKQKNDSSTGIKELNSVSRGLVKHSSHMQYMKYTQTEDKHLVRRKT